MARKNLLASVVGTDPEQQAPAPRLEYGRFGASRSMKVSIDEMAENAKKMAAGETIAELDTALVDESFVSDRIGVDDEDYRQLRDAIAAHGQASPILVRPHPDQPGRYMVVFGHRRTRVARELGVPVRAVIKKLEDIAHILAQGQENTVRANLSFIEKAVFAKKLLAMGQTKETIKSALTIDDTLLSRMLSVVEIVPVRIIDALGAAKGIGRDRWEELKKLFTSTAKTEAANKILDSESFRAADEPARFNQLIAELKVLGKSRPRSVRALAPLTTWSADGDRVVAEFKKTGKAFSLSFKAEEAAGFGEYVSTHLDALYRAFKESKNSNKAGD